LIILDRWPHGFLQKIHFAAAVDLDYLKSIFCMPAHDIRLGDFNRILLVDIGPEYLIEVAVRTVVIYIFFLVIMRLLGKRIKGQVTVTELTVIIMLGAVLAPSMQLPERGVVHALFILTCILIFNRITAGWSRKNKKIEQLTLGKLSILVKDGIIQNDVMRTNRISKLQLFAILRGKKIYNLGRVERLYLEQSGQFSLYELATPKAGLSTLPQNDNDKSLLTHVDA